VLQSMQGWIQGAFWHVQMTAAALAESVDEHVAPGDEAAEGGQRRRRRRRIHELAPAGMTALRIRRRDWEHFAATMAGVLGEVSDAGRT
jgi:hypothetical protein